MNIALRSFELPPAVKCLIVDDLEENLLALSALLRGDNVEVLTAASGAQALELLLVHDVALALLDVQMPDMDGFELAELMRGSTRTRHVPIIFLTAGSRDQHRLFKGYEAGGVDFLYKPIEEAVLKNKAEVFFTLHRHKQQLARQLEQRTRTLHFNEMFTAILGHDLRNPLAAIVASAELIAYCAADDTSKQAAGRIQNSAMRMTRMIDDLLDLARARLAGGIPIMREPVDIDSLIERVVQEHRAARPDRTIVLNKRGNLSGQWDADRMIQVVSNLLGNALHHGEPGIDVEVTIDGSDADRIELSVTNGGSIPDDRIASIFEPFVSGDNRARSSGLGLGLYIVQQIVVAHQGSIEARSDENQRTTFRVCMPRR